MQSKTLRVHVSGALQYITFPLLEDCGAVRHFFSTRRGGVSTGQYASMNLSFSNGDRSEAVRKNYEILCGAIGIEADRLVLSRQTHTANVRTVTEDDIGKGISKPCDYTDVDGLITDLPGVGLVTQYADCVPLLFCDPKKHVIATSHAGWRGTVAQIGRVTVERMQEEFGCDPRDILAGIGPSIGPCCYEVDEPVHQKVLEIPGLPAEAVLTPSRPGHYMLNLQETNRWILLQAGLSPDHIDVSDLCTCCHCEDLHSHRATGGKRGNLAAIIALK